MNQNVCELIIIFLYTYVCQGKEKKEKKNKQKKTINYFKLSQLTKNY